MPYDHGRNQACKTALEIGADYLFFLDSDVVAPPDTILRLLRHNLPIISGMYCRRSPPHSVPVMIRSGVGWVTDFVPGSMVEVDLVGAGCLLIRRDVLENVPPQRPGKRWFDWRVDCAGIEELAPHLSEDFTYCAHLKKYGFKIMVDTAVKCKHLGMAEADYGTFAPVGSTPMGW